MYNALDVADYVVSYCTRNGCPVTLARLNSILYFIQGYFLVQLGKPCFGDDIEAWDIGPVVPKVYFEYENYGHGVIPYVWFDPLKEKNIEIETDDLTSISYVLHELRYVISLNCLAQEQSPWEDAYNSGVKHAKISKEAIRDYFESINRPMK